MNDNRSNQDVNCISHGEFINPNYTDSGIGSTPNGFNIEKQYLNPEELKNPEDFTNSRVSMTLTRNTITSIYEEFDGVQEYGNCPTCQGIGRVPRKVRNILSRKGNPSSPKISPH